VDVLFKMTVIAQGRRLLQILYAECSGVAGLAIGLVVPSFQSEIRLIVIEISTVRVQPVVAIETGWAEGVDMIVDKVQIIGQVAGATGVDFKFSPGASMAFAAHQRASLANEGVSVQPETTAFMRKTCEFGTSQTGLGAVVIGVALAAVSWVGKTEVEADRISEFLACFGMASQTSFAHYGPGQEGWMAGCAILTELSVGAHAARILLTDLGVQFTWTENPVARKERS
jgi:hypothetical protein